MVYVRLTKRLRMACELLLSVLGEPKVLARNVRDSFTSKACRRAPLLDALAAASEHDRLLKTV